MEAQNEVVRYPVLSFTFLSSYSTVYIIARYGARWTRKYFYQSLSLPFVSIPAVEGKAENYPAVAN